MPEISKLVGVIVERRKIDHKWVDHVWEPVAVLSDVPEVAPWTLLIREGTTERFYIGAAELVLATTETAQYRDNLMNPPPRLWVVVREEGGEVPLNLVAVTADPAEGEAYTEPGASIVAAVPMPADIAGEIAAFVDAHHVERPFIKRKRRKHRDGEAQS